MDPGTTTSLAIPRPETDEELEKVVFELLGVRFPKVQVCSGHSTPWAAFCDAYFARSPVSIWIASRGYGGKTFMAGALAWMEAVTLRASVNLLGGSGEQSRRVHDYLKTFWMSPTAPKAALASDATATRTRLVWGNTVNALTASMANVSGPHPQRLRCDEVDVMDLDILEQALGQPMTKAGVTAHTVLSSARYEADGTLTEMMKRGRERGWAVHEWCWRETVEPHGWTPMAEVERQKLVISDAMWLVQYENQEPSPEGRAIVTEKVEEMFVGPEFTVGEGVEKHFEEPEEGAVYATGADWARDNHTTQIATLRVDVTPMRLVAYQWMRKRATPTMVAALNDRLLEYEGPAAHDKTGGGTYVADYIDDANIEDFIISGKSGKDLFANYVNAVEKGEVRAPRVANLYGEHKYVRNEDLFSHGADRGHPPDGVVAMALANHAAQWARVPVGLMRGGTEEVDPIKSQNEIAKKKELPEDASAVDRAIHQQGHYWPGGR